MKVKAINEELARVKKLADDTAKMVANTIKFETEKKIKDAEKIAKNITNTIKFEIEKKISKQQNITNSPTGYDESQYGYYEENGKIYIIDKDGKREYIPFTLEYGYYVDTNTGLFWFYDETGMTPYTPLVA